MPRIVDAAGRRGAKPQPEDGDKIGEKRSREAAAALPERKD
jgi:hypothetical protein